MLPSLSQLVSACAPRDIGQEVVGLISKRAMTEPEIARALNVSRYVVFGVIKKLAKRKAVVRRRVARRREDGQGFRKPWQYKIREV